MKHYRGLSIRLITIGLAIVLVIAGIPFGLLGNTGLASPLAGIITTVAGTGTSGYSGDGGQATNAQLNLPRGVAVDPFDNLFIADTANHCIRKVDTSETITTVAGTGSAGYSGDGGQATSAQLYTPVGVAVDPSGNLFIADTNNHRIRKVDTSGIITTIAGTGTLGYGGDGGQATSAQLNDPLGIAIDHWGNLFIADSDNHRVRKVDTSGIITTVAGTGSAGYSGDGGQATSAEINYPYGVAVDPSGNLFIAERNNNCIRKVDTSGIITNVAGTGSAGYSGDGWQATSAQLNWPSDVSIDSSGNIFIAEISNHCIREVDTSGIITTVAGTGSAGYSGDGGQATSAQLNLPRGVAVDPSDNLFIADTANSCIRKVAGDTTPNTPVGLDVTITLPCAVVTFDNVTVEGTTTCSTQQGNPYSTMPEGFRVRGQFVDITTTATYDQPGVEVCIPYDPSEPNPETLKLFHWEGGHWVDVTTGIDQGNHLVCGYVTSLSWFFIGGEWVWIDDGASGVPVFPSIYIGITSALGVGILVYFMRRRVM